MSEDGTFECGPSNSCILHPRRAGCADRSPWCDCRSAIQSEFVIAGSFGGIPHQPPQPPAGRGPPAGPVTGDASLTALARRLSTDSSSTWVHSRRQRIHDIVLSRRGRGRCRRGGPRRCGRRLPAPDKRQHRQQRLHCRESREPRRWRSGPSRLADTPPAQARPGATDRRWRGEGAAYEVQIC